MMRFILCVRIAVLPLSAMVAGCAEKVAPRPESPSVAAATPLPPLPRSESLPPLAPPLRSPSDAAEAQQTPPTPAADAASSQRPSILRLFHPTGGTSYAEFPEAKAGEFLPASGDAVVEMTGRIEHMGWAKSPESWSAGGSDYYVLVRDDAGGDAQSRWNRVILRETTAFEVLEKFKPFVAKRVEIRGRNAGYVKYRLNELSQYPIGSRDEDGYALHGGGLLVDEIKVLDEPAPKP